MSDKKPTRSYTNGEITVTWEPEKCIHAKTCWKEMSSVFKPLKRPWIKMENGTSEDIMNQIDRCPSGALGYYKNNEKMSEETQDTTVKMKANLNGSLKVIGTVEIEMPDGSVETKSGRFSICRCGLSENKPFCDGAHKGTDFDANWAIEKAE